MKRETYFKFMKFGPHTRLSLYMLLKHNALFFAHKGVLNDPTDCSPHFYVEQSGKSLEERVAEIASGSGDEDQGMIQDAKTVLEIIEFERSLAPSTSREKLSPLRRQSFKFGWFPEGPAEEIARELGSGPIKGIPTVAMI